MEHLLYSETGFLLVVAPGSTGSAFVVVGAFVAFAAVAAENFSAVFAAAVVSPIAAAQASQIWKHCIAHPLVVAVRTAAASFAYFGNFEGCYYCST